jgi:alkylation response protein AidB-like acyl-CoA dehydrogenase
VETTLTADQDFFLATSRKFLGAETPVASGRDRENSDEPFTRTWWSRGADLGWASMLVPEAVGGGSLTGEGVLDLVLIAEEMGRVVAPGPLLAVNVVAAALSDPDAAAHHGLLPALVSGERLATWAVFEEGRPWSAAGIELRGEGSPDGFSLSGSKTLVEGANQADLLLVAARTGEGLSQFLVPADAPGLSISVLPNLDLSRRYCRVDFDRVPVPSSSVVGRPDGAEDAIERLLRLAVVLQVAEMVGVASRVLEFTLEYLSDRFSFGRPLNSYQALKHQVADLKMWTEACAAVSSAAARAVQGDSPDAPELVSAAKAYVGEKATDIVQNCIQLHGGIGITWDHDLHLYLRRVLVDRFTYGTPDEHRDRLASLAGLS